MDIKPATGTTPICYINGAPVWVPGRFYVGSVAVEVTTKQGAGTVSKREGGDAADVQEEILAAACNALDKAHDLLSFLIRYDGQVTPAYMDRVKDWVDGEYDPGARKPKRCRHNWAKFALTPDMYCTRCGVPRSVGCQ